MGNPYLMSSVWASESFVEVVFVFVGVAEITVMG